MQQSMLNGCNYAFYEMQLFWRFDILNEFELFDTFVPSIIPFVQMQFDASGGKSAVSVVMRMKEKTFRSKGDSKLLTFECLLLLYFCLFYFWLKLAFPLTLAYMLWYFYFDTFADMSINAHALIS